MFKIYNSLSGEKEEFKPVKKGKVSMYTCGPTVYDFAHIGNFRAYLAADLLYRYLKYGLKHKVDWIMNITDVDDKTIKNSISSKDTKILAIDDKKEKLKIFTEKYEKDFFEDLKKLNIKKENLLKFPKATEHIKEMQELITFIYKNGFAYIRKGSVYFDIAKYRKKNCYGKLLSIDFNNFKKGSRIDADQYDKQEVSDFVLWKGRKENEPYWLFVLDGKKLPGRPGWHIECSAMEHKYFSLPFDIHTGGIDLKFPHHEDEIAQSVAGYSIDPTRFWVHNEHLLVEGQKMAKSLGNFYTLRDLEEKNIEPTDFRYLVLSSLYREKMNFTWKALKSVGEARKKLQEAAFRAYHKEKQKKLQKNNKIKREFLQAMSDDLNTPKALAVVFKNLNNLDFSFFVFFNNIFGVLNLDKASMNFPEEIKQLQKKRDEARKKKDFKDSDKIRKEIEKKGYKVLDGTSKSEIIKKT